jgi:hypothetical protein
VSEEIVGRSGLLSLAMPQAPARRRGAAPCRCAGTRAPSPAPGRAAGGGAQVLRLAATVAPGRAGEVALAVADRAAQAGAAVIVLDLGQSSDLGAGERSELCALRDTLRAGGRRLRLVAAAREARRELAGQGPQEPLDVHPTLRSAVLATYAELPGPGLVVGSIKAELEVPAEPLDVPAEPLDVPAGPRETAPVLAPHRWGGPSARPVPAAATGELAVS